MPRYKLWVEAYGAITRIITALGGTAPEIVDASYPDEIGQNALDAIADALEAGGMGGGGGIASISTNTLVADIPNGKILGVEGGKVVGKDMPAGGGGGLASVDTDGTLHGDGSPGSPLGVVIKPLEQALKAGPDGLYIDPAGLQLQSPRKHGQTLTGDGTTTSFSVGHLLGTTDIVVSVWDSAGSLVIVDAEATGTDSVTLTFSPAPAAGETFRAVAIG